MSQSNRVIRTYGSKPRKASSTQLWDGTKDVPRRPVLGENISESNERKSNNGIGGFMKGVVEWLSPRKTRVPSVRKVSAKAGGKENTLARERRFSLSDDEEDGDVSFASTTTSTLVASTPKKEKEIEALEAKDGIELLLEYCSEHEIVEFNEYIDGLLESATITKLGEATYSEVFTLRSQNGTTTVLKIIPFYQDEDLKDTSLSSLQDILQEIRISKAMAKVEGFADFQGYPPLSSLSYQ